MSVFHISVGNASVVFKIAVYNIADYSEIYVFLQNPVEINILGVGFRLKHSVNKEKVLLRPVS